MNRLVGTIGTLLLLVGIATARPDVESDAACQTVADVLREVAAADMAFFPAGMAKATFQSDDLSSLMRYPTDEISVVTLSGRQVRQAFERSVSLSPTPSDSFLQVSNCDITYRKNGDPENRIVSIQVAGSRLDETKSFTVAMPTTLARGAFGYFKVWSKTQITKTLDRVTLEGVLQGVASRSSSPRVRALD